MRTSATPIRGVRHQESPLDGLPQLPSQSPKYFLFRVPSFSGLLGRPSNPARSPTPKLISMALQEYQTFNPPLSSIRHKKIILHREIIGQYRYLELRMAWSCRCACNHNKCSSLIFSINSSTKHGHERPRRNRLSVTDEPGCIIRIEPRTGTMSY